VLEVLFEDQDEDSCETQVRCSFWKLDCTRSIEDLLSRSTENRDSKILIKAHDQLVARYLCPNSVAYTRNIFGRPQSTHARTHIDNMYLERIEGFFFFFFVYKGLL
jgi:hypothetical protein